MAGTSGVGPSGDPRLDAMISGSRWTGIVTYSTPASALDYEVVARSYEPAIGLMSPLGASQRDVLARVIDTDQAGAAAGFSVEGFTGLEVEAAPAMSGLGDIRAANTTLAGVTAFAYLPMDGHPLDGDMLFGSVGRDPVVGNFDFQTVLHELGHAFGLEHPHEVSGGADWDSPEFTVMTYRAWSGQGIPRPMSERWGAAQTFMMSDIAALQHLYGADFSTRAENTVYRWDPATGASHVNGVAVLQPGANRILQTIWDGGGVDTYDLSAYGTDVVVDLAPAGHSVFATGQLAYLGGGPNGGFARGNVFNALQYRGDPRSLIENATGGSGDDALSGNAASNVLQGRAGGDLLYGLGGHDTLDGGTGSDRMHGGPGNDTYRVDAAGDRTIEGKGGGRDTVIATASWALEPHTEVLRLLGPAAQTGTGNDAGNVIIGTQGANRLDGRGGADRLRGLDGPDRLDGGAGPDVLIGGRGADVFRFVRVTDSPPAAPDRIRPGDGAPAFEGPGAAPGDRIDLRAIDADITAPGDQAFAIAAGRGAGSLWLVDVDGTTHVRGDVNGRPSPDFGILIEDGAVLASAYTAADFLL
jgi:serralysin